jgi:hypothetical protein
MSVRLDAATERLVSRLARERKRTKSEVVREAITALARQEAEKRPGSPYAATAHLLGCADSGGAGLSSPEVARRYRELLMQRSGEERLKMGCSMHAAAKALVRASILEKEPLISPAALRQALFLRFYGDDFDPEAREKILGALGGHA